MYCTKCGAEIENNARFCVKCGAEQKEAIPERALLERPKAFNKGIAMKPVPKTNRCKKIRVVPICIILLLLLLVVLFPIATLSGNKGKNIFHGYKNEEKSLRDVWLSYTFSEGLEWVRTRRDSLDNSYHACVDQTGNVLFYIDVTEKDDILYCSPFSNGYSFLETKYAIYQIDSKGNVVNTYTISDNLTVKTYAEGQVWVEEYTSNFDTANYTYTLYGENREKITEFSVEGTEPIYSIDYCGKGVWTYSTTNDEGNYVRRYYCTQSNKWIEPLATMDSADTYFYEDIAVLGIQYENPDETGYGARLIMMDTKGNISEAGISADLGWVWYSNSYIKEGYCILKDREGHLVSYNVSSGEFEAMNNEYAEKVNGSDELMFTDGAIALSLKGNDENYYVGLFDTSWNIIGEPIELNHMYGFSEGKLIVQKQGESGQEIVVYNTRGEQIFNASEKGYRAMIPYENGVAYVIDTSSTKPSGIVKEELLVLDHDWYCIDEKGEYLFEKVNMSGAIEIKLE